MSEHEAPSTQAVDDLQSQLIVDLDVPVPMRDGVVLRANVYRSQGDGPWPVLLMRTPYGKNLPGELLELGIDPLVAAASGFMVVIQDTRGRFASEGRWKPFSDDGQDGYDTVEWAARLPHANGRVAMYGSSYAGITQWLAARERPPSLAAISPAVAPTEPLDGLLARGGAVELGISIPWTLATGVGHIVRTGIDDPNLSERVEAVLDDWDGLDSTGFWELPVGEPDILRRHGLEDVSFARVLSDDSMQSACRIADRFDDVTVPTFVTTGWYDTFLQGSIDGFTAMQERGVDSRLLIGPWTHQTFADPVGQKWFGMRATRSGIPAHPDGDVNQVHLAWFAKHLSDKQPNPTSAPVRIFVMGKNIWRDEESWPLERAQEQRWILGPDGTLTQEGDSTPANAEVTTDFAYDPADPVPTIGGQTLNWAGHATGPVDYRRTEERADVCVFTSAPLEREVEVTGRVRVVIRVESSAPSTDWVARLCDVDPDGASIGLCDGITRVTEGADRQQGVLIDLWSTSNVFLPGHRIRVHVTSSNFPRWDRNLNTGDQDAAPVSVAQQRIHHGPVSSYIELPVVPTAD